MSPKSSPDPSWFCHRFRLVHILYLVLAVSALWLMFLSGKSGRLDGANNQYRGFPRDLPVPVEHRALVMDPRSLLAANTMAQIYERLVQGKKLAISGTTPKMIIAHHGEHEWVSKNIIEAGSYDSPKLGKMKEIFTKAPAGSWAFMDIGGNIGQMGLWAMAHGHHVMAFEPNRFNAERYCESVLLNQWQDQFLLVKAGVSDVNSKATGLLVPDGSPADTNLGGFHIVKSLEKQDVDKATDIQELTIVKMDDMLPDYIDFFSRLPDRGATVLIMKVDIEGSENLFFKGATNFFKTVRVENVFLETVPSMWLLEEGVDLRQEVNDFGALLHQLGFDAVEEGSNRPIKLIDGCDIPLDRADNLILRQRS